MKKQNKYEIVFKKNGEIIGSLRAKDGRSYTAEYMVSVGLHEFGKKFYNSALYPKMYPSDAIFKK